MRIDEKAIKKYDNLLEYLLLIIIISFFSRAFVIHISGFFGIWMLNNLWASLHATILLLIFTKFKWIRLNQFANHAWVLIALCFISVLWSDDVAVTLKRSILLLSSSFFGLYLGYRYRVIEMLNFLMYLIFLLSLIGLLIYPILPEYVVMPAGEHAGIFRGIFNHKNFLGRINILGIICALTLFDARKLNSFNTMLFVAFFIFCVLLSKSAGSLLILIAVLALYVVLSRFSLRSIDRRLIQFILIIVALLVVYFFVDLLLLLGKSPTLTGRTVLWGLVLLEISHRPLLGHGFSAFWSDETRLLSQMSWDAPHAHNGYLDIALDLGVVGVMIYVIGIVLSVRKAWMHFIIKKTSTYLFVLLFFGFTIITNTLENQIFKENDIMWLLYIFTLVQLGKDSSKKTATLNNNV
ncbi:O-antigen ligase family protein [Ekhidna sp.]